jgi:hypothetical protein
MDTLASMDEDLHDLFNMPGIGQEQSWENLSIDLEPEIFTDAGTPTGPQHYVELGSPLPKPGDGHFATSFFQPRTFPDMDHSFQQNSFQDPNESLGPRNSTKAAKAAPQERLSCERLGCNSSFTRQRDLQRHVISRHVQYRSYKCAITGCDGTFSRLDKLREHQRRKHAAELPSLRRDASTATTRAEHYQAQSLPNFEYLVKALNMEIDHPLADGSGHSIPKQMDRISYKRPQSDRESSTPATEYSYGLIEESSGVSNLNSRGGSISTRSRSPCKTITSNNRDTVHLCSRGQDDHTRRRFACPYQKHDPRTYNIRRYRTCASSGWDTLSRVK